MLFGPSALRLDRIRLECLIAALLCLVMTSTAFGYKFGDFPGKGNYQVWRHANNIVNEGLAFSRAGKYDEAIPTFEKAIASYPHDAGYVFNLAVCYEDRNKPGDLNRALGYYKRAAQLAPDYWEGWNGLARVQFMLHQYTDAKTSFIRALGTNLPASVAEDLRKDLAVTERKIKSTSNR